MTDVSGKNFHIVLTAFLIVGWIHFSSCTRSAKSTSQVNLSLPSSSQMSSSSTVEMPMHIAVNVSAPDMPTLFWSWDSHGSSVVTAPPNISLTVNQGLSRLIQVLYVSGDSDGNMYFYYNDITQDLTAAAVPVAITVTPFASSAIQGKIVGRYVNASGSGPTGVLNSYYAPGGKPAMIVDQNEIFGGWFSAFSLPSQNFTYKAEDGTVILDNYRADASFASGSSSTLVSIPASYRFSSGSGTPQNYNSGQNILAGFFGPGSTGKKICLNPVASVAIPHLYTDVAGTAQTTWNGSGSNCGATQSCLVAGGATSLAACATIDPVNTLKLDENLLSSTDQILLFRGPFQISNTGSGNTQQMTGNLSGSSLTLGWQFMPGATAGVDGIEAFYKWEDTSSSGKASYQTNSGYDCEHLTSNFGFASGAQVPTSQLTSTFNVGSAPVAGQGLVAIICPYSNSKPSRYFHTALQWNNNSYSTSNYKFKITDAASGSNNTGAVGVCKHLAVQLQTAWGVPYATATPINANISVTSSATSMTNSGFSLAANCASPTPSLNYTLAAGSSTADIYFIGTANDYYMINAQAPGVYSEMLDFGVAQSVATFVGVSGVSSMAAGMCYPIEVRAQNSGNKPAISNVTFQMALSGSLTGDFFNESTCTLTPLAAGTTISMPASSHATTLFFKPNVTTLVSGSSITLANLSVGLSIFPQTVSADIAAQLTTSGSTAYGINSMMGGGGFDPGQCLPLNIYAVNSVGAPITPAVDQSLHITSVSGGTAYTGSCGGPALGSGNFILKAGQPTPPLYFMPNGAGITIQLTDGTSRLSTGFSMSVNPPANFQWIGTIPNMGTGMCYPASVQAFNSKGQIYNFMSAQNYSFSGGGSAQLFSDSACVSSVSAMAFPAAGSTSTSYIKFTTPGAPTSSLTVGANVPINFAGLGVFQTFLIAISPASGCTTNPGGDLIFNVKANATLVPAVYVPSLSFTSMTFSGGTFAPKFCSSSGITYGSCVSTANLNLGAGQNSNSGTPLNIKTSGQVADSFMITPGGLPTGVQINSSTVTCN